MCKGSHRGRFGQTVRVIAYRAGVLGSNPAGRKTPQPTCTLWYGPKGGTSVPKAVGHCVRMRATSVGPAE